MKLTEKQESFVNKASRLGKRLWTGKPYILVLRGYAGTGKTTALSALHEKVGDFIACAPTGKAALRIREATGIEGSTIHRWLYTPSISDTGKLVLTRKPSTMMAVPDSRLLVIDEASMVNLSLWEDAYNACKSLGMNIVCVGDNFQLPPVAPDEDYFNILDDAFKSDDRVDLTEVQRQALESPIIRASMNIRQGDVFEGLWDIPRVTPANFFNQAAATFDKKGAVIVHKNITRHEINSKVRAIKGFEGGAQPGEPLLVLQNNYVANVFNGEQIFLNEWIDNTSEPIEALDRYKQVKQTLTYRPAVFSGIAAAGILCNEELKDGDLKVGYEAVSSSIKKDYSDNEEFSYISANFGYALTAHKSQGSEWKNVLVGVEDSVQMNSYMGRRWLYTAITRAKDSVSVCIFRE